MPLAFPVDVRPSLRAALLLIVTVSSPVAAQDAAPAVGPIEALEFADAGGVTTRAVPLDAPLQLDGSLTEPLYETVEPITGFVQNEPLYGQPATERTEVWVSFDDENVYVSVRAWESEPDRMVVNEMRRDNFGILQNENFAVILDTFYDRRSGVLFQINPLGGRMDGQVATEGNYNSDWNPIWRLATGEFAGGWTVEMAVPFKSLSYQAGQSQVWGINFRRINRWKNEVSYLVNPPAGMGNRGISFPSFAATMVGLEAPPSSRTLDIKPYAISDVSTDVPSGVSNDVGGDVGLDVRYALTQNLSADFTWNTDFAQVEADEQQVNLTRFSLFFPEKREFFLENTNAFTFGPGGNLVPFFSRRIGLSAAGTPVPVLVGARTSGRAVNNLNVGVLAMRTDSVGTVTPANNYVVGRARRNFLTNSWVGGLGTHRDSTIAGDYNNVYGGDAHFQFFADRLEFDGYVLRSDTPDRDRLGENLARRFQTGWRGDELSVSAEYNAVQPNFNPEVGFVRRGDMSHYNGDVSWAPRLEHPTIQNLNFGTTVDYYTRASIGSIETRVVEATAGVRFNNNGSTNFTATRTFDRLFEPFPIRSTIPIPAGDYEYASYAANVNIGNGRQITGNTTVTWGEFWNGHTKALSGAIGWRPEYHFSFDANYSRNHVTLPNGAFTTNLIGTRFLYAFTPRAFFNAFLQYNADTRQVSANIRFNITYRPLSDMYLVYNHTRDGARQQTTGRSFVIKLTRMVDF